MTAVREPDVARAAEPHGWVQVPELPPAPPVRSFGREVLALGVGAGAAVVRTAAITPGTGRALAVLGVAVCGGLLVAGIDDRRWVPRLAVAVAAGVAAAPFGGRAVGVLLAAALVLADWGVRLRRPAPFLPEATTATTLPVVAVEVVAGWRGTRLFSTAAPILLTAAGLGLLLLGPRVGRRVGALGARVGEVVGWVVSAALFATLGALVVALPWVAHRVLRVDPLDGGAVSGWVPRARRDVQPTAPWAVEARLRDLPARDRWRRLLVVPVVVALLLAATAVVGTIRGRGPLALRGRPASAVAPPAAFRGDAWWPEYSADQQWFFHVAFDPADIPRIRDVRSRYLNVRDGVRVSWEPPPCSCRRLRVWVYGGSTAFGLGQRDGRTIASDLARLAWRDGIALDVVNRGVPGDLQWMEAERFAWDLAVGPRPDLVVFYDGINDMGGALYRQDQGRSGDTATPVDPTLDKLRVRDEQAFGFQGSDPAHGPGGATVLEPRTAPRASAAELAAVAMQIYEHGRDVGRSIAAAHHVPVLWFWQPSRFTRTPADPEEPHGPAAGERWSRSWWAAASRLLPADVHDVSGAIDGVRGPVYWDDMHTNEVGARAVASRMYAVLAPHLRALHDADRRSG